MAGYLGEVVAEGIISAIGPKWIVGILTALLLVVGYTFAFGNTETDFCEAKDSNRSIECKTLLKTYRVTADEYSVQNGFVVVDRFILKPKRFNVNDCEVQ